MVTEAPVQCGPGGLPSLPFFSRYHCHGSSGIDVIVQDVFVLPGTNDSAFGCCFPPPNMAGAIAQHIAECRASAVLVFPGVPKYWFLRVQRATFRSRVVALAKAPGICH